MCYFLGNEVIHVGVYRAMRIPRKILIGLLGPIARRYDLITCGLVLQ